MSRTELTKTFIMLSNSKNHLVTMVQTKYCSVVMVKATLGEGLVLAEAEPPQQPLYM